MFKSEAKLVQSFLDHAPASLWSRAADEQGARWTAESRCSDGRADMVWATANEWPNDISTEAVLLLRQPTCSRILALLKNDKVRSEAFLSNRAGVAETTFRRWMAELLEHELVYETQSGRFVLADDRIIWPSLEICAFEFKLEDWKRALYQAKRYRTFSHRVYVVLPAERWSRVENNLEMFSNFNIGLILHYDDGESERVLYSRKENPKSKANFIRAIGMLLNQKESPARVWNC